MIRRSDGNERGHLMATTQAWYLEERAEALAMVHLTRRDDLRVRWQQTENGIDLLVEILKSGQPSGRLFGLLLKAQVSAINGNAFEKSFLPEDGDYPWIDGIPFPVCIFFFTMQNNAGYYRWLTEPVVTAEGGPKLRATGSVSLEKLTSETLDHLIHKVNNWYDSLSTALAA